MQRNSSSYLLACIYQHMFKKGRKLLIPQKTFITLDVVLLSNKMSTKHKLNQHLLDCLLHVLKMVILFQGYNHIIISMGQCAGTKSKVRKHQLASSDIQEYNPINGHQNVSLSFHGYIDQIKIRNAPPQEQFSIQFIIEDILELTLPRSSPSLDDNLLTWKIIHDEGKFAFVTNQYELRKKNLEIYVKNKHGKIVEEQKLNMYYVVSGPYHHDFKSKINKNGQSRLIFDVKISQDVEFTIEPQFVNISINQQYPGQEFNYSLGILLNDNSLNISSPNSDSSSVPLQIDHSYRPMSKQQQCPSPTKKRKTASKLIKTDSVSKINWNKRQHTEMGGFKGVVKLRDLFSSTFQFILWKNNGIGYEQFMMFAEAFFPTKKIFSTEATIMSKGMEQRNIQIKQQLLDNGKKVGQLTLKFQIFNNKFHQQLISCARTQDGIVNLLPLFNTYRTSNSVNSKNIDKIYEQELSIYKKNLQLNKLPMDSFAQARNIRKQMAQHLQIMLHLLETTNQDSFMLSNNEQIKLSTIVDQDKLLQICERLYSFIEEQDLTFSDICWKILIIILKRGEFLLGNLSLVEINGTKKVLFEKKLKIAIRYQSIVYKILSISLKYHFQDVQKQTIHLAETFKAYCFIRVPIFRQVLLSSLPYLNEQDDDKFGQPDRKEVLNDLLSDKETLVQQIDWQSLFYSPLLTDKISKNLNKQLEQCLNHNPYFDKIKLGKNEYYFFIKYLSEILKALGKTTKFHKWQYFPGYVKIMKSFMAGMKKKEIADFPKNLIITCYAILNNQKMINPLLNIILEKTNSFNSKAVMTTLDMIYNFFNVVSQNKPSLPLTFNYVSLFKSFKIILQCNFSYGVAKALVILYTYYQKFAVEFRKNLTKYLLGKNFYKLFYNWSHNVRDTFHHMMVLKFDPDFNSLSENMMKMNEVSARYKMILYNIEDIFKYNETNNPMTFDEKFEPDLYKRMRRKLKKRKIKQEEEKIQIKTPKKKQRRMTFEGFTTPINPTKPNFENTQNTRSSENEQMTKIIMFSEKKQQKKPRKSFDTLNLQNIHEKSSNDSSQSSKNRNRRFSFFGQNDFDLMELSGQQKPYIKIATSQFREISEHVKDYYRIYGKLPEVKLQVQLALDQRDLRVSSVDTWN